MAIAFRSSTKNRLTSLGTSLVVTKPSGTVDGDVLVAFGGNSGPGAMTLSGWTELKDVAAGNDIQGALWWKVASGEGASYTITTTNASNLMGMIAAYSGASGVRDSDSNPVTTNSGTAGSTTSPVPTALSGVVATDMVIQAVSVGDDAAANATTTLNYPNSTTYPGWDNRDKYDLLEASGTTWGNGMGFVDKLGATGTMPRWTVAATARQWVSLSIALIEAPTDVGAGSWHTVGMQHHHDELAVRGVRRTRSGLYVPGPRPLARAS